MPARHNERHEPGTIPDGREHEIATMHPAPSQDLAIAEARFEQPTGRFCAVGLGNVQERTVAVGAADCRKPIEDGVHDLVSILRSL